MPAWQLRPRSAPEIVDASVQLVREHARALLTLSVVLVIPGLAVSLIRVLIYGDALSMLPTVRTDPALMNPLVLLPLSIGMTAIVLVLFGAMVASASAAYLEGRALEPGVALRRVIGRAGALLGSGLLTYLLVFAQLMGIFIVFGILFAIVAGTIGAFMGLSGGAAAVMTAGTFGIVATLVAVALAYAIGSWLIGRYVALPAVVMNESLGARAAMRRARELAQGSARRVTALLMITSLIFIVAIFGTIALFELVLHNGAAGVVALAIVKVPLYAFVGALSTVLYYDLRIRHEGLDIELLADELAPVPPNVQAAS